MVIRGQILNGGVELDGQVSLPDGTRVLVVPDFSKAMADGGRVELPLVPSSRPGSRRLDADRLSELLDDDVSP